MPIGSALGIVGAGLLGDIFSSQGQQNTNATNMQISQQQNQFNAQQAQLNRDFQTQTMQQAEEYDTQMSDTAMQRRVADLKAAGLNPMLAVGQGGASSPQLSGMSGSTASSAGLPNVQNPMSSFTNAGSLAASAVQAETVSSQIDANTASAAASRAQANKANADAGLTSGAVTDLTNQNIAESKSRQALMATQGDKNNADAALDNAQIRVADATLPRIQADIANLKSSTNLNNATANLRQLDADLQDLNVNQFAHLSPEIVKSAIAKADMDQMQAGMLAKAFQTYQGSTGTVGAYMDRIADWFHLGVNLSQFGK